MKWFIVILGIACNAAASVLIKIAITPPRQLPSLSDPFAVLTNWPLILGLTLYGGAFLFYALALTKLPLNMVHPVMTSGAIAVVAVLSVLIFQERFPWTTGAGIALVVAGIALITSRSVG